MKRHRLGSKSVGTFEGLNVETLKRKRLTVEGRKSKKESGGVPIRSGTPAARARFALVESPIHD
jgi:hypothetical protein